MQKILLLIVLVAIAGFASAATTEELKSLWTAWKSYHKRQYSPIEDASRFEIFVDNYYKVIIHNAENEDPKLGLNKFADLSGSEWKSMYTGGAFFEDNQKIVAESTKTLDVVGDLPDSFDWRPKGAVTPIKDQGQCGSCWTFSTTGTLEGFYFINNGSLLSFSEQQIVDCDTDCYGCNGGWPYLAVQYAGINGLEEEADYPYTAQDGTCNYDASKTIKTNNNYTFITPNSSDSLKAAIVNMPVSVVIEADQNAFQLYKSGTIWRACGSQIDHAVLAVGYGKQGIFDAFIVKNSWGTTWGDEGYVYIAVNEKANNGLGVCGILSQPVVPN